MTPFGVREIVLHFQPDVLEEVGVPESLKVAPNSVCCEAVTHARKDSRLQRIARDASISDEINAGDDLLVPGCGTRRVYLGEKRARERKQAHHQQSFPNAQKYPLISGLDSTQGRSPPPKFLCSSPDCSPSGTRV